MITTMQHHQQQKINIKAAARGRGKNVFLNSSNKEVLVSSDNCLPKRHRQPIVPGGVVVVLWERVFWFLGILLFFLCTNPANHIPRPTGHGSTSSSKIILARQLSVTNYGVFAVRQQEDHLELWALLRQPLVTCSFVKDDINASSTSSTVQNTTTIQLGIGDGSSYDDEDAEEEEIRDGESFLSSLKSQRGALCERLREMLCHQNSKAVSDTHYLDEEEEAPTTGQQKRNNKRMFSCLSSSSSYNDHASHAFYRLLILMLLVGCVLTVCLEDAESLYYYQYYRSTSAGEGGGSSRRRSSFLTVAQRLYDSLLSLFLPDTRDVLGFCFWNIFDASVLVYPALRRMDHLIALQTNESWFRMVKHHHQHEEDLSSSSWMSSLLDAASINYAFACFSIFLFVPTLIVTYRSLLVDSFYTEWNTLSAIRTVASSASTSGRRSGNGSGKTGQQRRSSSKVGAFAQMLSPPVAPILGFELLAAVSMGFMKGSRKKRIKLFLFSTYSVNLMPMAWIRVFSVALSRAVLTTTTCFESSPSPPAVSAQNSSTSKSSKNIKASSSPPSGTQPSSWSSSMILGQFVLFEMLHVLIMWAVGFVTGSYIGRYMYDNQTSRTLTHAIWKETANMFNMLMNE